MADETFSPSTDRKGNIVGGVSSVDGKAQIILRLDPLTKRLLVAATLPIGSDLEGGGKISVGTTAVEMTFTGTTESIILTADPANSGTIYIGKSNVTNLGANAITFLSAGEHIVIDYDDVDNAVYAVGSAASQNVWKGAIV